MLTVRVLFVYSNCVYMVVFTHRPHRVEQVLHRNLVFLASIADPGQNIANLLPVSVLIN